MSDDQLTMSVKGTFYFMPPEVYNREHYDYRADIYSLGMVLYRLLNKNRGPFMPLTGVPTAEQKEMDLARRMRGEQLPAPILAGQKLGEIILKACEYQKEKRFQSMEEFYQALCSLTQEDMERPGSMISDNEQTVVPRKEMFQGDDNETIALNQLPGDQTITTSSVYKENTYIVDDDRTVKMNMPKMESEGIAPPVVPQEELVGDHPSAIKEHRGKRVHVGIVGVVLAVVCLCAAFVLPRVLLEQSTKDDEVAQEETQKTLEDPTVSNEKSEDEEAKDETKNKPEEKIMIDAIPEVNALISDYYKAYASGDVVALEKMARPISDSEKSYIKVFSEYVDFYDNLSCYTKSGVRDGEYIVSVYLEIKFKDVPTAAPGLDFFYLRTNEIGQLYIDNVYSWFNSSMMEYDTEADIAALISDFEQDEKILKLQSEVQQKYEQAVAADERLAIIADEVIPNDVITKWEQSLPQ